MAGASHQSADIGVLHRVDGVESPPCHCVDRRAIRSKFRTSYHCEDNN